MCLWGAILTVLWLSISAIEIQPVLVLLVQGVVTLMGVRFKYDLSVNPWALMRGEEIRLMSGGRSCLIRRLTVEAGNDLWVKKGLPHLLVLPGCRLPHHLQLLLYFPKRGEKTYCRCGVTQMQANMVLCRSLQHTWKQQNDVDLQA